MEDAKLERIRHDFAEWARAALDHADMKQVEASRRLSELLQRQIDKAAINKMLLPAGNRFHRRIAVDELLGLAQITGYPIPLGMHRHQPLMRVPLYAIQQAVSASPSFHDEML